MRDLMAARNTGATPAPGEKLRTERAAFVEETTAAGVPSATGGRAPEEPGRRMGTAPEAVHLSFHEAEGALPLRRAQASGESPGSRSGPGLGATAEAFLAGTGLDASSRRSYAQTLRRLQADLGETAPLREVTADQVARIFHAAWAGATAATWNRHRAALRSFAAWAGREELADGLPRRAAAPPAVRPAPVPRRCLQSLLRDPNIPARDRALWRVLHESGATVSAVLGLDVEDLDLSHDRARGQARRRTAYVCWHPETTPLVAELAAGRESGPLFLSARRPAPARTPADAADLCPRTGRRRLSYARAEYLFKRATRGLDPTGSGFTLRTLRVSG